MTGEQFVKYIQDTLKDDPQKHIQAQKKLADTYPFAIIEHIKGSVIAKAKNIKGKLICMRCGTPMQYIKVDNEGGQECTNCMPGIPGQPISIHYDTWED